MSIKELAKKAPQLCEAKQAAQYGRIAELVYEDEASGKTAYFSLSANTLADRIEPVFAWKPSFKNILKKLYIKDLILYACYLHYQVEHGRGDLEKSVQALRVSLLRRESRYPDVAAIQSVGSVRSIWA